MSKEVQWGLGKRLGPNDWVNFVMRYDQGKSSVYEYIYRWYTTSAASVWDWNIGTRSIGMIMNGV